MLKRLLVIAIVVAATLTVARSTPEVVRYLKVRSI
jgi:hypothetical protein